MNEVMICAACNKNLVKQENGSYIACCRGGKNIVGAGYWTNHAPLPKDAWWVVPKKNGLYKYQRVL